VHAIYRVELKGESLGKKDEIVRSSNWMNYRPTGGAVSRMGVNIAIISTEWPEQR
jgi:hypothetical protein